MLQFEYLFLHPPEKRVIEDNEENEDKSKEKEKKKKKKTMINILRTLNNILSKSYPIKKGREKRKKKGKKKRGKTERKEKEKEKQT